MKDIREEWLSGIPVSSGRGNAISAGRTSKQPIHLIALKRFIVKNVI
jgi:hypothetical protein